MKEVINKLIEHKPLGREEASNILKDIASSKYNPSQIAAFLTTYMMRSITVEELSGFRDALLELCIHIDLSAYDAIDLCGTGGDGKDTFNISTLASFVTSGAGVKVAKHGNYGVSSVCGSSNVLEHFGLKFTIDKSILEKQISEAGICFLHAPLFHPAMKNVAPIRKELGVKTFFNMLGPMVNPSFPKKQLVGVFNLELARLYSYLYQQTDMDYVILHGLDGYDEISLTSDFKLISKDKEQILNAADLKLEVVQASDLFGGSTVEEAARLFNNILEGNGTQAQNQVVIANAAMAIHCSRNTSIEESVETAKESLESGKALDSFNKLISIQ
ncbi:MAG: anthranilate phosphoribosyltransferase [Bacteroidetes bacterium]|nr:MAG: anthranilate phosphoribosyltransferase [Bacteroidota bacterium]